MKMTSPKSFLDNFKLTITSFLKKGLRKVFPTLYLIVLVLGLIVAGFYPFVPTLAYCSSLFGEEFCTPLGFFIMMAASLPGYLIVGNILKFFPASPILISILLVIFVSFTFYFFLGKLIDTLSNKSITSDQKLKIVIAVTFLFLAFLAMSFA